MNLQLNLPTQPPWGQKKVAIVGEVAVIDSAKKVAIVERWALVDVDCVLSQNIYSFGLFTAYRREF